MENAEKFQLSKYGNIQNVLINEQNIDTFYHFCENIKINYRCVIMPAMSNLKNLIEKKLLFLYIIIKNKRPVACYVFRNPYTYYNIYKKDTASMDCIASYRDEKEIDNQLFVNQFYFSITRLQKIQHFECLLIENISNNNIIIQNIFKKHKPIIKSPTAYYFYNFAYKPLLSKEVFLLN